VLTFYSSSDNVLITWSSLTIWTMLFWGRTEST